MTQIAQVAACNRHHSLQQRLCRWLLSSLDKSSSNELAVTQEAIAGALGVRREGITAAAGRYQRTGSIRYHRGYITVPDQAGLEKQASECYQVVKQEFDCLLPDVTATQAVPPRCMPAYRAPAPNTVCAGRYGEPAVATTESTSAGTPPASGPEAVQ